MPRYIDADAFIIEQCNSCDGYCEKVDCDCLSCDKPYQCGVIQELKSAPTVSDDEIRGVGEWRPTQLHIECSVCGAYIDDEVTCVDTYGWPWEYCPKCGAKMEVTDDA